MVIIQSFSQVLPLMIPSVFPKLPYLYEWKNSLHILGFSFVSIVHRNLPRGNIQQSLKECIILISSSALDLILPSDIRLAETVYYIAGWLLCAIGKESHRRGETIMSDILENINISCCIDKKTADSWRAFFSARVNLTF